VGDCCEALGWTGCGTAVLLITHDMSVVGDIANEGGPHVCRAHRAACATSANRPVPGRQLTDHPYPRVTTQWQIHTRRLRPRSTFPSADDL
jgi:hypothetical protein